MDAQYPHLTLWRLVLEAATPLSIGTGRGDGVHDVTLAHDANGLPCLPASALAGVLRAAFTADHGPDVTKALFGHATGTDGAVSRLEFSHGHIHDSYDKPMLGLVHAIEDPLLKPLVKRRPTLRQRVRIDHRGVADARGLFDRSVLPAGHRFSAEISLWSAANDDAAAKQLDDLLWGDALRVGGLTRSGLGRLSIVRAWRAAFDLSKPEGLAQFAALGRSIASAEGLTAHRPPPGAQRRGTCSLVIKLTPEAGFRFGSGHRSLQAPLPPKLPDDLPMTESRVEWTAGSDGRLKGELTDSKPLVAATGVKGPLSHRVAFHANRRTGVWAEDRLKGDKAAAYDKALECDTVRRLFGWAPDERSGGRTHQGQAGVLWWTDLTIEPASVVAMGQWHNSIDRFTGGVRRGALFTAENLYARDRSEPLLTLRVVLDLGRAELVGVTDDDIEALEDAAADLCKGRLALGADSAGGQGFFEGECSWEPRRPALGDKAPSGAQGERP